METTNYTGETPSNFKMEEMLAEIDERLGLDGSTRTKYAKEQCKLKFNKLVTAFDGRNLDLVEALARDIAEHGLTLGATNIVQLALELQTLSRCRDSRSISSLILELKAKLMEATLEADRSEGKSTSHFSFTP